jgi:spore maturation protein CgeB
MRILYGGYLDFGATSEHRLRALRRLFPAEIFEIPFGRYLESPLPFVRRLTERILAGPGIAALNRALIEHATQFRPDLIWLDKPVYFPASTIRRLRDCGFAVVAYMPDDPFGPRRDRVWRHFKAALPYYSAHVVPREVTRRDFLERGAERVACVPFAFEPTVHFVSTALNLTTRKDFDVSFVGSPYDRRAEWIARLARQSPGLRLGLFGPGWDRFGSLLKGAGLSHQPAVWNDQYREVLWRSRLSLSFVTRGNRDELSHKAIEIAASGTAVLVEHSSLHNRVFRDRESAFFFDDPGSLADIIARALAEPELVNKVGAAGAGAVHAAGLSNDEVLRSAFAQLQAPNLAVPGSGPHMARVGASNDFAPQLVAAER